MILAEQDDEWQDGRRYFRPETMAAHRRRQPDPRRWAADADGELTIRREDDALLHHVLGLDPRPSPAGSS